MTTTSSEPTVEDLRTAVAQLTKRLAASGAVNAGLLELIDEKNAELRVCHGEIRRLARENEDLTRALEQARQQRLEDPPRRWALGRGRIGNSL